MPARLTIDLFRALARERGGECLSTEYINIGQPLRFRCAKGHEWETKGHNVRAGNWCSACVGRVKHTLAQMQALARERGGECLSAEYRNANAPLQWRCAMGHEWTATASDVKNNGSWCPKCAYRQRASKMWLGLDVARELARERGGECLSTQYPTGPTKTLRWRCADGHEWEMPISAVRHMGQWCPVCASGLAERFCRAMFEAIFDAPFPKARPSWLRNSRGGQMELDGYNDCLKLAFEYHGEQHYSEVPFFHRKSSLAKRIEDDNAKLALCAAHGVALIAVPYTTPFDGMQHFIYQECAYRGVALTRKPPIDIDRLQYYRSNDLDRMREYAATKGGKCLTEYFPGVAVPALWECAKGHQWRAKFHEVRRYQSWCPVCSGKRRPVLVNGRIQPASLQQHRAVALLEMKELAKSRGGECLSTEYQDLYTKLKWRCSQGHEWSATAHGAVYSKAWCPKCAGVARLSLADAQAAAKSRGGEVLSLEYINATTKMRWRCGRGHEWLATLGSIKAGSWCAVCAGKARLTIEEMRALAAEHGGACLSPEYTNLSTKLHWRCANGHEWWSAPGNIKAGSWCPTCGRAISERKRSQAVTARRASQAKQGAE